MHTILASFEQLLEGALPIDYPSPQGDAEHLDDEMRVLEGSNESSMSSWLSDGCVILQVLPRMLQPAADRMLRHSLSME